MRLYASEIFLPRQLVSLAILAGSAIKFATTEANGNSELADSSHSGEILTIH
jgi:hypothetical protein